MPWYAKRTGGYSVDSVEARANVDMLASALRSDGWCNKAIAALLGNGAGESGLNPWRWESDYVPTYNEFANWSASQAQSHGYGLFGFTPASSYINSTNATRYAQWYAPNFSDVAGNASDGEAQTLYFRSTVSANWTHNLFYYYDDNFVNIGVDISTFYWLTFDQFKRGYDGNGNEMTVAELTGAFELCYEKPADWAAANSYNYRVSNAEYWYDVLGPSPTPTGGGDTFDIMFYLKPKWKKY